MTGLPKSWLVCLIFTGWVDSGTNATGSRRRIIGTVRTRGGSRRPANCIVASRNCIAALSVALQTIPKALNFLATEQLLQLVCQKKFRRIEKMKRLWIVTFSGAATAVPTAMFENTSGSVKKRLLNKIISLC